MSKNERPRWRVNEPSLIGNALAQQGDEVYYTPTDQSIEDGHGVASNLTPLNDAAQDIVDGQKDDHPDKSKHAAKRARQTAVDDDEEMIRAQETTDGLAPKSQRKGDTRKPADPAKKVKGAPAKTEDKPQAPALGKGPTVGENLGVDGGENAKVDADDEDEDIA